MLFLVFCTNGNFIAFYCFIVKEITRLVNLFLKPDYFLNFVQFI
jgi:hypothetical protein